MDFIIQCKILQWKNKIKNNEVTDHYQKSLNFDRRKE